MFHTWEHLAVHQFSGQHWGSKGYQKDIILPLSKDLYWLFNSRAFSLQIKWLIVNRFTLEIFVEFIPHPQLPTTGESWYLVEGVIGIAAKAGDIKMWVRSLGWEPSLEEGMIIHSSILAWRTPWTEEPGGLQSIGSQSVGHNWSDLACDKKKRRGFKSIKLEMKKEMLQGHHRNRKDNKRLLHATICQ